MYRREISNLTRLGALAQCFDCCSFTENVPKFTIQCTVMLSHKLCIKCVLESFGCCL